MPVSYSVSENILTVTKVGEVSTEDFVRAVDDGINDTASPEMVHLLIDSRESPFHPTPDDIKRMVTRFAEYGDRMGKRALVAQIDLLYGLGKMASAYEDMHQKEMQVFETIEKAEEWLRGLRK